MRKPNIFIRKTNNEMLLNILVGFFEIIDGVICLFSFGFVSTSLVGDAIYLVYTKRNKIHDSE